MSNLHIQFLNSSSEEDIESTDTLQDALPLGCSKVGQGTNKSPVISQSAKRSRHSEIDLPSPEVIKEELPSSVSLLRAQIEIQTKLYDAVSKSLEDNKENSKSMQYNTRRMYEALERISVGSLDLIRTMEAQNIEEARHHKVMESIAKQELQINQKLLELKMKKERLRTS